MSRIKDINGRELKNQQAHPFHVLSVSSSEASHSTQGQILTTDRSS